LAAVLQSHHTWNPEEVPASIRYIIDMTWLCRACEVQNPQHLEWCRSCKQHWGEVWKPAKRKTRSRSKSQKYAKGTTSDTEKKGDE
jgi:ribosomal protein L40E